MWLLILEKVVCEKPDRARGSCYLSGRYGMDCNTPLSPWSWVATNRMKLTWSSTRKTMNTQIDRAQYEDQNMHTEWSKQEWARTWTSNHECAIMKQNWWTMDVEYSSCISECKMKIKQNTLSTTVDNRKGSNIGPPPKPQSLFMN